MLIAVCFHRFGPYHVARLAAAARQMNIVGIEFSANTRDYAWDPVDSGQAFPRAVVVPEGDIGELPRADQRRRTWRLMDDLSPDVVAVNGWSTPDALAVLAWAAERRVPVVMMSDTTALDHERLALKDRVKQRVVARCGGALVAGARHREYMRMLGMPDDRIFAGYDVVDNEFFWDGAQEVREAAAPWRKKLGLPEHFFLTSARFLRSDSGVDSVKNLHRLVKAYARYLRQSAGRGWGLVVLGDGELRPELEAQISELGLTGHVLLPGFKQYQELPAYYGLASVFVLASVKDTWGLVVNEAMASGLPVLVSERCGCAADLVDNGRNGYIFDPYDVEGLARLMLRISSDECDRAAMGLASREIISRWTPETFTQGLAQAVDAALAVPLPRAVTWADKALLWALSHR